MATLAGAIATRSTVEIKTTVSLTVGDVECALRELLEEQGVIRRDQEIDFDWDIGETLRGLSITWTTKEVK